MSERLPDTIGFQPGSGEAEFAAFLDRRGTVYHYESRVFDIIVHGKARALKPDFRLETLNVYIEIINPKGKGRRRRIRFKKAKAHAVHRQHGETVVIVCWDPDSDTNPTWEELLRLIKIVKISAQRERARWLRKNRP